MIILTPTSHFIPLQWEAFPEARILRVPHSNKTQSTFTRQGGVLRWRRVAYLTALRDEAGVQSIGTWAGGVMRRARKGQPKPHRKRIKTVHSPSTKQVILEQLKFVWSCLAQKKKSFPRLQKIHSKEDPPHTTRWGPLGLKEDKNSRKGRWIRRKEHGRSGDQRKTLEFRTTWEMEIKFTITVISS